MFEPLYWRTGDLQPKYYFQVVDGEGNVKDLTGATITTVMTNLETGDTKINDSDGSQITLEDAENGKASFAPESGDTDTAGDYEIRFTVDPALGEIFTVPAKGQALVFITD